MVKCLPTMRKTWVQSLDREDLLEKEMVTHSSILAWRIPWTEKHGVAKSRTQLLFLSFLSFFLSWLNGKESTCQCRRYGFDPWARKIPWRRKWQLLGNPMDRGVWRATVHGVSIDLDTPRRLNSNSKPASWARCVNTGWFRGLGSSHGALQSHLLPKAEAAGIR